MLHGLGCGEEAGARNFMFFRVKWLQPVMKGTSSVRRVRLGSFCARIVASYVFCKKWLFLCTSFYAFLEALVADRIGIVASRLLGAAAACVILLSFAAEERKSYWNACIKVVSRFSPFWRS